MDHLNQIDRLLNNPAPTRVDDLRLWLAGAADDQVEALAEALKDRVIEQQRADIDEALQTAAFLMQLAEMAGDHRLRALAYRTEAQARMIGLGEFKDALAIYDHALMLYRRVGDEVGEAQTQGTRIWALASLGRYDEATTAGQWAVAILHANELWIQAASVSNNLAGIYSRMGNDVESLGMLDSAREAYRRAGDEASRPFLSNNAGNRGVVLRKLGRFDEALVATRLSEERARTQGQTAVVARARQNLGLIALAQGHYNEALRRLDEAKTIFWEDGRLRDAMLVELFTSTCLLEMRRFDDVLEKAREARKLFTDRGTLLESAQCRLNEAAAYAALGQLDAAGAALAHARETFAAENHAIWVAFTDVRRASLLNAAESWVAAEQIALAAATTFLNHDLEVDAARAWLVAAEAAQGAGRLEEAETLVVQAQKLGLAQDLPGILHLAHALQAGLAHERGDLATAAAEIDAAIAELERLQGGLMVEYRAGFLEDKLTIYEDGLLLALERGEAAAGLAYAERAKSRALLDMISYRLQLGVVARSAADQPLVTALERLRVERDRLYRVWESGESGPRFGPAASDGAAVSHQIQALEQQMTQTWHTLLVRNADYARDAGLWRVRVEPAGPYLDDDTLLVEYFVARGHLVVFLVSNRGVDVVHLPGGLDAVQPLQKFLGLNMRAVAGTPADRRPLLLGQAQTILRRLHDQLVAPFAAQLAPYERLIVVPHGPLHYLPFHALYDGERYVGERHRLSYLPGASFVRASREAAGGGHGALVAGHSDHGRLPSALAEAQDVAALWQATPVLEERLTRDRLQAMMGDVDLIHLATHGEFRADNPLFSGLVVEDGWLTTLDIFGLRLHASLVTLSACDTGRHVIAAGDELLGLMRAFLSAGAASLLLTHWPVEDRTTAVFMADFYRQLRDGSDKDAALQTAQSRLIHDAAGETSHPYFWAPFYLVGSAAPLPSEL